MKRPIVSGGHHGGFLACAMLLACAGWVAADDFSKRPERLMAQNKRQQQAAFAGLDRKEQEAGKLAGQGKYAEADRLYAQIQDSLNKNAGQLAARRKRDFKLVYDAFRRQWGNSLLGKARLALQQNKFSDAVNLASEASLVDTSLNQVVGDFIERTRKRERAHNMGVESSLETADPGLEARQKSIDKLLREAQVYAKASRFDDARIQIERIFLLDPFNQKAAVMLNGIYKKLYDAGLQRRAADVRMMQAIGDWTWVEPVFPVQVGKTITRGAQPKQVANDGIYGRMEKIIFPSVEFDDADISSVIRFLNRNSRRYDPSKEGVTIIPGFAKDVASRLSKVTMSFNKISMTDVLRYLCRGVYLTGSDGVNHNLRFKVDDGAIVIGVDIDELQRQNFQIRGDLLDGLIAESSSESTAGTADSGPINRSEFGKKGGKGFDAEKTFDKDSNNGASPQKTQTDEISSEKLKKAFGELGVSFGENASIAYSRRSGQLIVHNTAENLQRMDDLLRILGAVETPLVLIETKMIKVEEADIQELGFEWYFSGNGTSGDQVWSLAENKNPLRAFNGDNEPNATTSSSAQSTYTILKNLKIFPNFGDSLFGENTSFNLSVSIDAISRNTRTETLSAPRIITMSGNKATMDMVEEVYYADDWDSPSISVSGSSITVKVPVPDFGDAISTGVLYSVQPTVNPDNYTITLHLQPSLITAVDGGTYSNYTILLETGNIVYTTDSTGKVSSTKTAIYSNTVPITMPEVTKNEYDVHVKVYDGETIMLGGMIENKTVTRDDKWPLLGDLPLVGRLFRSQLDYKTRKTMLIFVTARLINNDGVPVRRNPMRGVPDFNR